MGPDPSERLRELGSFIREQRSSSRGLRRPSAEILQQIAKGLAISAETLYVRAGILEPDFESDLEVHIHADPHLSAEQRQALIQIYRSFVGEAMAESPSPQSDGGNSQDR